MKPRQCASENHGGVIEKEQLLLHPTAKLGEHRQSLRAVIAVAVFFAATYDFFFSGLFHGVGGEVPFVDNHNARAMVARDEVGNFFVLLHNASFGIHDEHGDVATLDGFGSAGDAEVFKTVLHAAFFAKASGVDELAMLHTTFSLDSEGDVHRITRGAGDFADDHAIALGESIDDGRLADVRAANDGEVEG